MKNEKLELRGKQARQSQKLTTTMMGIETAMFDVNGFLPRRDPTGTVPYRYRYPHSPHSKH